MIELFEALPQTAATTIKWATIATLVFGLLAAIRYMIVSRLPVPRVQIVLVPSNEFQPSQSDLDSFLARLGAAADRMTTHRLFANPAQRTIRFSYLRDYNGQVAVVVDLPEYARMLFQGPLLADVENWSVEDIITGHYRDPALIEGLWAHHQQVLAGYTTDDVFNDRGTYVADTLDSIAANTSSFVPVLVDDDPTSPIAVGDNT